MSALPRLVQGLPEDESVAAAIVAGLCAYLEAQVLPAEPRSVRGGWIAAARLESQGIAATPAALSAVRGWAR